LLYNCFLDACVVCGDLKQAASILSQAEDAGIADTVTYNTLMKGYLATGQQTAAERVLKQLKARGVPCTPASYHGLLQARAQARDQAGAWRLISDMRAEGLEPNAVTCSILLKGASGSSSHAKGVRKILDLIDGLSGPLDEVLLSAVVETCTRSGDLAYLQKVMARHEDCQLSAASYGCMIKAFSQANDLDQVWKTWRHMSSHKVRPTEITLGCMIEALVSNQKPEEAWQLLQDLWADASQRLLINTVTYTTVLKGFGKQPERVLALFEEMKSRGVECNTITYNTILNVFAQIGDTTRLPELLEDMKRGGAIAEPDMVTYSTLIKAYCAGGDLSKALGLFEAMKKEGKFAPDEMMYNTLLDGCAKAQRITESLKLVEDMRSSGVVASNYTLSMLVKLLGRCRKLGQAFSIVDKLSSENGFKPNIQVYTCLIMACFHNRQPAKALAVLDRILNEGLKPDERVFSTLVKGCLQSGELERAAQVVERAHALNGLSHPVGVDARIVEEVVAKLGGPNSKEGGQLIAKVNATRCRAKSTRASCANAPWKKKADPSICSDSTASGGETGASSSDSDCSWGMK